MDGERAARERAQAYMRRRDGAQVAGGCVNCGRPTDGYELCRYCAGAGLRVTSDSGCLEARLLPPQARRRLAQAILARHLGAAPLWRRAWWWLVGAPAFREDA